MNLHDDQEAYYTALQKLDKPSPPLQPIMKIGDLTLEGVVRALVEGLPSIFLSTSDGGRLAGGVAMNSENKRKTTVGLCQMWDGSSDPIARQGGGATRLPGRRLSLHVMVQDHIAAEFLHDDELLSNGFLSRCLFAEPESLVGSRFRKDPDPLDALHLEAFHARIRELLERPMPLQENTRNVLQPRLLRADTEAADAWWNFHEYVETAQGDGGDYSMIQLAGKAAQIAARLAAVLTIVDDPDAGYIGRQQMENAIKIITWYLDEAVRLLDKAPLGDNQKLAEEVNDWLQNSWSDNFVSLPDLYQYGPKRVRSLAVARKTMDLLTIYGWVRKAPKGTEVRGKRRRDVYEVYRG